MQGLHQGHQNCRSVFIKQVRNLSPATLKEAELVHFVSSKAIRASHLPNRDPTENSDNKGSSSSNSEGGVGGGGGNPDNFDPKGKGKGKGIDETRNFEKLGQSLRQFVLDQRSKSKLAPAKTYLLNILNNIHVLATVNSDIA
jgi:mitofusin 2